MNFSVINAMIILLLILYCGNAAIDYVKSNLIINVCQDYIKNLRERMNEKILKLPLKYFDGKKNGETLSLLINDIENINMKIQGVVRNFVTELCIVIGSCVMLYTFSPVLIAIIYMIITITVGIMLYFTKISRLYFEKKQEGISDLNELLEENYSARMTIQIFDRIQTMKDKYQNKNENLKKITAKSEFFSSIAGTLLILVENVTIAIIAIVSSSLHLSGTIEIGYIYTIISYTQSLTHPLKNIAGTINDILSILASSKRIYCFLDEKIDEKEEKVIPSLKDKILVEDVKFGYSDDKLALENININIPKGSKIAFVGKTGSGKTTLIKLIMNIYSANKGKITFDNMDLKELDENTYLKNFSIISQDINLFADTVMENIKYGNPDISDEEVIEIAKRLDINDTILELEKGYNTFISENNDISSGTKQLIAFMQNAVSNASIFIFDEATNMLDRVTEEKIENAINYIRKNKTMIMIAHRLKTIKDSDYIYVIDNGKVIEEGTHEVLMKNNKFYAKMYNS